MVMGDKKKDQRSWETLAHQIKGLHANLGLYVRNLGSEYTVPYIFPYPQVIKPRNIKNLWEEHGNVR